MSPAPGVLVDLGSPCRAWQRARQLLGAATVIGLLAWVGSHGRAGTALTIPFTLLLVGAMGIALALPLLAPRTPRGQLLWNTTTWLWLSNDRGWLARATPGRARIAVDLGHWLLIEFSPTTPPHGKLWLPVSRGQAGPRWHAMQCALRQRAIAEAAVGPLAQVTPGPRT